LRDSARASLDERYLLAVHLTATHTTVHDFVSDLRAPSHCSGFGALLGPLVVAANIHYDGGFHLAFLAIGIFNVLSGLLFLLVPSPTPPPPAAKHSDASAPGSTERGRQMLIMFAVFYSFFFWYETTEPALAGWISSYVTLVDGVQPTAAAALPSVYWRTSFTGHTR
jgi:fucose permease